ncbi:hypothetical protein N7532_008979 [Penicillium argentinense]|uniref:Uncharacterized protein n=1 Tax=Penicillium argentinense TaxID=1131581 RepID=A0A9W9EYR1_9EURO|nr:uncharacterized protein N7532_008979 [Penicillium argentinense]KAJ5090295.1 hypothetical protein N7532_008979 [Penicillium argentinense]
MSRSAASLKQWLQLRRTLSSKAPSTLVPRALNPPLSTSTSRPTTTDNGTLKPARSFHSSRPRSAAKKTTRRAPSVIEKERTLERSKGYIGEKGNLFLRSPVGGFLDKGLGEFLKLHEELAEPYYDMSIRLGFISRDITLKTYKEVGRKLVTAAFESAPNAAAIRAISVDVDTVFRIGHCVMGQFHEKYLNEWTLSACGMAKARMALVIIVNRAANKEKIPPRSEWVEEIKKLAALEYPPAMLLHAKILGQRGQYEDSFRIFEKKIFPRISPTRSEVPMFDNIRVGGMESPYRLYALYRAAYDKLYGSKESREKADEATRIAALEYNDPDALVEYASLMMNENNLDMYEECMVKAASGGHQRAGFYLGNFYYLTYHGQYPTREQRSPDAQKLFWLQRLAEQNKDGSVSIPKRVLGWAASFFNQSLSKDDYRLLAVCWYEIGGFLAHPESLFMRALFMREVAVSVEEREDAAIYFETAADHMTDPQLKQKIVEIQNNWFDPCYEPSLPKKLLAVR